MSTEEITRAKLDSINVEQARNDNKANLLEMGGAIGLAKSLDVNINTGLSEHQVTLLREKFGDNTFPQTPVDSYLSLLLGALSDTTLLILIVAACVSLAVGIYEHGTTSGWIEGGAIFIAVFLVSNMAAMNDYSKQLQFLELEKAAAKDEMCTVMRSNVIIRMNPKDLVVGDILIFHAGDSIPADCVIVDQTSLTSDESSLTGEPEEIKKSQAGDPFLLSSCLVNEADETRAMVISVGMHSQWGKIKATLVTTAENTPLQDKLEDMTKKVKNSIP